MPALRAHYETGMTDMNSRKTAAFLAPEGYEAAGRREGTEPGDKGRPTG